MSKSINLKSYPLIVEDSDIYFVTDKGIHYHIYLTEGADYLPGAPFSHLIQMFGFQQRTPEIRSGIDFRIRATITNGILAYFDKNPDLILTYVCDMMDGRQRSRSALFDSWYRGFENNYKRLTYTDGQTTYCGMLYRINHPHELDLEASVAEYIKQKGDWA